MPSLKFSIKLTLLAILFCCWVTSGAQGQDQQSPQTQSGAAELQEEDTLRISTDLIQTGVTVFDKQGRFVDRLSKEDFELRVDGKAVPVSFFERVETKSAEAAANAGQGLANEAPAATASRGRTVIFFVDDLHLSQDSTKRARDLIRRFIDREAESDDLVAIASTSGKIGFLQQFTNDPVVLRAATERLKYNRDFSAGDRQYPAMSEYEALLIDRNDSEVVGKFVGIYLRMGLALDAEDAENEIHSRARTILQQAAIYAKSTYATLELLVRRSGQIPGRKVVFFVSDGFFLDTVNTDSASQLRRITDAAARANAVVYSFDAKGLDASLPDGTAATFRTQAGERFEFQDPLNALAQNTGGRFIHNTNDLGAGMSKALAETSAYYLLAWQPDPENRGQDKFRNIEVGVKGRPDLLVRVQRGYLDEAAQTSNTQGKAAQGAVAPAPESQLRAAFNSLLPRRALPTSLVVNYLEAPQEGPLVLLSMQIESDAVKFTQMGEKATAEVDVVGAIFNSTGKREAYFNNHLTVNRPASGPESADHSDIYYNSQTKLNPGLYQVRVASRDAKSGRVGSATKWIEVPDLSSHKLALSSLLLGERTAKGERRQEQATATAAAAPGVEAALADVQISVDHRFAGSSHLRYLLYIYNAARGQGGKAPPDVALQTQIFRGSQLVITSPSRKVSTEGQNPSQISYAAEVSLEGMPAGRYMLQVAAIDRVAKTSATQRVNFEIR